MGDTKNKRETMRQQHSFPKDNKEFESLLKRVIKAEEWDDWKAELVRYFKVTKS